MYESQKGHSQLVIASSDPAEDLELIEKALDQMPLLVGVEITGPRIGAVLPGWDGVAGLLSGDIVPDFLRTIGFVAQNVAPLDLKLREQINGRTCIMHLTAGEQEMYRITQTIDNCVDFCGLTTPAGSDKLVVFRIYSPFFAPALCGCALMEVLSMQRFS